MKKHNLQYNKDYAMPENTGFLRGMLENISLGGLLVDKDRTIQYCNGGIKEIFGYESKEVTGKRTDLLYDDRRKNLQDKNEIHDILEKRGFHTGPARGVRKDGKKIDLELSTFIIKSRRGAIILLEKKGTPAKPVVNTKKLLQELLNSVPDMIYFKDLENKFILVNKEHATQLKRKPEEVIGKTDLDFFPKKIAEKYYADDKRVVETGKSIICKIEKATRPKGGITYVSTTKIPHYDKDGNIIGTIGITRNITDQMIAEEELRLYKDNLERLVRERTKELAENNDKLLGMYKIKSEFTSMVSHELRTPLSIIKEGVLLVEDGTLGSLNSEQKSSLEFSLKNIGRLSRLITDILDFSKLESKKMEFRIIDGNLNEIVDEVARSYSTLIARRKGVKLKVVLDPALPLVRIDEDRVAQVLHNLIGNAFKFTDKGYIKVETKTLEKEVAVSVKDTGRGIEKKNLPRIFGKFEQVYPGDRKKTEGTGLGLAICKQIVEQLGGRIFVKSQYKKGTSFCFTLPINIAHKI